jgi:hypothetical protein
MHRAVLDFFFFEGSYGGTKDPHLISFHRFRAKPVMEVLVPEHNSTKAIV